jgi:hypothetical protein
LLVAACLLALSGCGGGSGRPSSERDPTGARDAGPVAAGEPPSEATDAVDAGAAPVDASAPVVDQSIQRTQDTLSERTVSFGPAVGRRLTREEYLNSIEVVTGLVVLPDDHVLPLDHGASHGFHNSVADQLLSRDHIRGYLEIAEEVAARVDVEALLEAHAPCREARPECSGGYVESLGRLLLRAPISAEEEASYVELFERAADTSEALAPLDGGVGPIADPFAEGARLVLRVMLQSPRFVYRLERQSSQADQTLRQVDDHELATRLSFLVWNAAPDAELLDLADAGELREEIVEQVDRMLDHPRARRALRQYVAQWLDLDSIPSHFALAEEMTEETLRLFEYLLMDREADAMSVFTARRAEVSGALARFYGFDDVREEVTVYDVSAFPYRSGFLSNAGVILAHTINPDTSMIDRGLFVLRDLLCGDVPPPTGEALRMEIEENRVPVDSQLSQRERFATQRENPLCASCHGAFDPLGEPFEIFDATGGHITQDEYGNPLSDSGHVLTGDMDADYGSFAEFTEILAGSRMVERCFVQKSIQHAFGRALGLDDTTLIDEVHAEFESSGRTYRSLLRAIALHPSFTQVEVAP